MKHHRMAGIVALLTLAACGGAATDVSVPLAEIAEAPWEREFSADEMDTWREGTVRFLEGRPQADVSGLPVVAGATVELFAPHPHGRRPLVKVAETRTGPDGRFRVGPGPATRWVLRAQDGDSVATYAGQVPLMVGAFPLPEGPVDVLLRRARDLDVVLVDGAGDPVPGEEVLASTVGWEQLVITDGEGRVRFRAPEGAIRVVPASPMRSRAPVEVTVPRPAGAEPFVLEAPDHGPLEGWVRDAVTGEPLSGAAVLHLSRPDIVVTTDGSGRFSLEAPRDGRVAAFGRGVAWRSYAVPAAGEIELRLHAAAAVTGRVVGPDGAPVSGARLTGVTRNAEGGFEPVRGPLSRADGTFSFDWLPRPHRGASHEVHFVAHRRGLGWSEVQHDVPNAPGGVELRLGGESAITGVVTRASEEPCDGVDVVVESDVSQVRPVVATLLGLDRVVRCTTDAEGRFAAPGVPAHVPADVQATVDTVRLTRRVEPGDASTIRIELPEGESISGRIEDVAGQPVTLGGEARAELLNHPELRKLVRNAPINPDGSFVIEDLPAGTYSVRATVPSFRVVGAVTSAGASNVVLVAERPADLDVEVVFPSGAEPEPVDVRLDDAEDPATPPRTLRVVPDASGARGTFELVRHGRYHVTAAGGAWRCRLRDVDVVDGRRPPLRLELERTIVRSLVLQGFDGQPLSGRRVIVAPIGGRGVRPEQFFTGEGGAVEIGGLAEGRWIARVVERDYPLLERRFEVTTGDAEEILLRYPDHGTLEVVVDRDALASPDAAVIALTDAEGRPLNAWGSGSDELASRWRVPPGGRLTLQGVLAGAVGVTLTAPGGDDVRRETTVEGARTTTLRLP